MSTLSTFFKGSDTRFGVFHPNHYLIALLSNLEIANQVEKRLLNAGFSEREVVAVPGEEVMHFAEEQVRQHGLAALLMQELSRLFGTEEIYVDEDLELAAHGAAFVAVHCPCELDKRKAWALMEPLGPLAARYYSFGGVEHLAGDFRH